MADATTVMIQSTPDDSSSTPGENVFEIHSIQFKRNEEVVDKASYLDPVDDSENSKEIYLRLMLRGITPGYEISNIHVWLISPSAQWFIANSGTDIKYKVVSSFSKPINTAMVGGVDMPTSKGTGVIWTTPQSGDKLIQVGDVTDYLVLQVQFGSTNVLPPTIRLGVSYDVGEIT